jgi:Spy/CpxP family protein refolding chaperone
MKLTRRMSAALAASMLALGAAAPGIAAATDYCPPPEPAKKHCNAGRGNGSEGCDPGNSSTSGNGSTGQNMGGDEGGPISGGTGAL